MLLDAQGREIKPVKSDWFSLNAPQVERLWEKALVDDLKETVAYIAEDRVRKLRESVASE